MGILKAEVSQLRDVLGGMLGSRPYRLLAHVEADFLMTEQSFDAGYIDSALKLCTGAFSGQNRKSFFMRLERLSAITPEPCHFKVMSLMSC